MTISAFPDFHPHIVGIGGTSRPGSSTEQAVRLALAAAQARGASTCFLGGADLSFTMYAPHLPERGPEALRLVRELKAADGVILASPGYHGGVSGLVKNALDYLEDLRADEAPYLDGRAVGLIVTAAGWQATGTTLNALRSIVHALRGWPTPFGVTINTTEKIFAADGICLDQRVARQLAALADQVIEFAMQREAVRTLRALAAGHTGPVAA